MLDELADVLWDGVGVLYGGVISWIVAPGKGLALVDAFEGVYSLGGGWFPAEVVEGVFVVGWVFLGGGLAEEREGSVVGGGGDWGGDTVVGDVEEAVC